MYIYSKKRTFNFGFAEDKNFVRIIEEKMIEKFDFLFIPSTKLVMVQQHWLGLKFVSNEM